MAQMEKLKLERKGFTLWIEDDAFAVDCSGERYFSLPVRSAVDSAEREDVDEPLLTCRVEDKKENTSILWTTFSSLWKKKEYRLDVMEDSFLYRVTVYGEGKPEEIRYFQSRVKDTPAGRNGGSYETAGYLLPASCCGEVNEPYSMQKNNRLSLHYMVPPMLCYPFFMEEHPDWFGLGLAARPGQYNFDSFYYHNHDNRFHLSTRFHGHTTVAGQWEAPGILGCHGMDGFDVLSHYSGWHYAHGYAKPHPAQNEDWWYGPFFCGWGEQAPLGGKYHTGIYGAANQKVYTEISEHLDQLDLHPTALIIDDKWQKYYGEALPDPEKWPDLRGFVDSEHKKGRRVVLWFKSWNCEGLDQDECVTLWSQPVGADPTSPKYQERIYKTFHKLLSSDEGCYNCDRFKIDFANCMPLGEDIQAHEKGVYGIELLRRFYELIYKAAKAAKPDALINNSNCHPYLAEFTDQVRLHDYDYNMRSIRNCMKFRRDLVCAAMPGISIDTDFPAFGNHKDCMSYIRFAPSLGVPDLYRLSDIEDCVFTGEDWDEVRRVWKEYRENLKK